MPLRMKEKCHQAKASGLSQMCLCISCRLITRKTPQEQFRHRTHERRSLQEYKHLSLLSGAGGFRDWGLKPGCCPFFLYNINSPLQNASLSPARIIKRDIVLTLIECLFSVCLEASQPLRRYWLKRLSCFTLHLDPHLRLPFRYFQVLLNCSGQPTLDMSAAELILVTSSWSTWQNVLQQCLVQVSHMTLHNYTWPFE